MDTDREFKKLKSKLDESKSQLNGLLDDYKKYFLLYSLNPTNSTYSNYYNQTVRNIQNIFDKLSDSYQNVTNSTELSNNKDLADIMNQNKQSANFYKQLKNTQEATSVLKDDYDSMFNEQYLLNSEMFLGIIFLSFILFNISKQ